MFETTGDILRMSLAIGFIVFIIFLCVLIFYLILVTRDVAKMTDKAEDVVSKVHNSLLKPLSALDYVLKSAEPYIESIVEAKKRRKKKKKKK